jgi:hypothetical protein
MARLRRVVGPLVGLAVILAGCSGQSALRTPQQMAPSSATNLSRLAAAPASLGPRASVVPAASPPQAPSPAPTLDTSPVPTTVATPAPTPVPWLTPAPTASPGGGWARLPIVPVAGYRSVATAVDRATVAATFAGRSSRWQAVETVAGETAPILAALELERPVPSGRLIEARDAVSLARDLADHPDRLGFLRAAAVGPSVRALAWDGQQLFGVHRVRTVAAWALAVWLPTDASSQRNADPAGEWTMLVAGDVGVDRGVALAIRRHRGRVDYPYDGGTARIVGTTCCSAFGWRTPVIRRTGDAGAVRDLIRSADLALANLEGPTPARHSFHATGTVFTGDPALVAGLARAGFDVLSLANNHAGDAGGTGIFQTVRALDRIGIAHAGAGRNLVLARRPAIVDVRGVRIAVLAYDTIAPGRAATAGRPGTARLTAKAVRADVAAARAAGADVVIVFPHWGVEYTRTPSASQRRLAHAAIDAGADLVIGNHPHWVQAMEVYRGRPIWYALGNFTFDQDWSEPTMTGITLELTFRGSQLVQAWMRPHVLVGGVQPNLLERPSDTRRVLVPVFNASRHLGW